jgi:Zn-dependent peptidase ImmA (M78 family)
MPITVPYLPDDAIRYAAAEFLARHHSPCTIPAPIEQIVDFDFGIDIVPIPGMHRSYDIDSMLSKDLQQICVDTAVFENFPGRYRFSLAHEVGHRQLHADFYSQLAFRDIADWKNAVSSEISEKDYGKLEFQANTFAGLILVPPTILADRFRETVSLAKSKGVTVDIDSDIARNIIEGYLSREFVVSQAVIQRRMKYDKLWES